MAASDGALNQIYTRCRQNAMTTRPSRIRYRTFRVKWAVRVTKVEWGTIKVDRPQTVYWPGVPSSSSLWPARHKRRGQLLEPHDGGFMLRTAPNTDRGSRLKGGANAQLVTQLVTHVHQAFESDFFFFFLNLLFGL